jgi:hypothetical protein
MELYDISQIPQKIVCMKRWSEVGMIDYIKQGEKEKEDSRKEEETRRKAEESGFAFLGDNQSSKKSMLTQSNANVRTTNTSIKLEKQEIRMEEMLEMDGDGMPYEITGITSIPRVEGDYFVVSDNGGCVTILDNDGEKISMLGVKTKWPGEKFKNTTPYTLESVLNRLFFY